MIAHLYICNRSFRWNGSDKLDDFQRKLVGFRMMMERINEYPDENLLFLFVDSFLKTKVLENVSISDFISDYDKALTIIGKEAYVLLLSILKRCNHTKATIWDLKEYLSIEDENNCHAVIVFSPLKGLESNLQLISTEQGWLSFRRHYLGKYPSTPTVFLSEASKYFPCIKIHPDNTASLRDVIHTHAKLIVYYLSALNDSFVSEFFHSGKDLIEFLPWFALTHNLDDASLEGNKDSKFFFRFTGPNGDLDAYCEAHLKIYHDDNGNSNQHCRIYFKRPIEGEPYLYVGFIGNHL